MDIEKGLTNKSNATESNHSAILVITELIKFIKVWLLF